MKRFEDRVVVITGGGGNLGRAAARRLSEEGATVVVADLDEAAARETCSLIAGPSLAVPFDAADEASINALVQLTLREFGRCDVLINNVGGAQTGDTTLLDIGLDDWELTFRLNLRCHLVAIRAALPSMIAAGKGTIVNIASRSALGGAGALAAYGCAKSALVTLTQYVAVQYGREGIRCNAICPGPIRTPSVEQMAGGSMDPVVRATYVTAPGEVDHIAAAMAYLGSDDSGYTNGAVLRCDGGSTAALAPWMAEDGLEAAAHFKDDLARLRAGEGA